MGGIDRGGVGQFSSEAAHGVKLGVRQDFGLVAAEQVGAPRGAVQHTMVQMMVQTMVVERRRQLMPIWVVLSRVTLPVISALILISIIYDLQPSILAFRDILNRRLFISAKIVYHGQKWQI